MSIIYTNQSSKKKSKKPTAKQRELQSNWEKILKKYESKTTIKKSKVKKVEPFRRETPVIPSLGTYEGQCTKSDQPTYTGTQMIGIATLHKSNAVPVFSQDDAVEISRMRRG